MMDTTWLCPDCGNATVSLGQGIELPPDLWSDEITLHPISCSGCPFHGVAFFEESRRGKLGSDCWRRLGYHVAEDVYALLQNVIAQCPNPADRGCDCPSHLLLGGKDAQGARGWLKKCGVDIDRSFPIRKQGPDIEQI